MFGQNTKSCADVWVGGLDILRKMFVHQLKPHTSLFTMNPDAFSLRYISYYIVSRKYYVACELRKLLIKY